MQGTNTVPPDSHSTKLAALYGRNVTTSMRWPLRRTIACTLTFGALCAIRYAPNPVVWATAAAWIAAVAWVMATYLLSAFARVARSPRCAYRLRDRRFSVLYIGRTRDWEERFGAHTETAEDHDKPWRYRIDADHSGPFRWCITPLGEWACERFRIRQAVTLGRWRLAPNVYNRQLNRRYRFPMSWLAVLIWFVEEMLFGIGYQGKKNPASVEPDPEDGVYPESESDDDTPTVAVDDTPDEGHGGADPWDAALIDLLEGRVGDGAGDVSGYHRADVPCGDTDQPQSYVVRPGQIGDTGHAGDTEHAAPADTPPTDIEKAPTVDAAEPATGDANDNGKASDPDAYGAEAVRGDGSTEGAAGVERLCKREGCGRPGTHQGPRCAEHYREYQRQRKADLRRKLNETMPDE